MVTLKVSNIKANIKKKISLFAKLEVYLNTYFRKAGAAFKFQLQLLSKKGLRTV